MATFLQEEDKDKKTSQLSTPSEGGLGTTFSGGSQSNTAMSAPQENRPQGSGRFTNIQQYLGANQGAGARLGAGIERKADEYLGGVREGIQQAQGVREGVQGEQMRLARSGQLAQRIQDDSVATARDNLDEVTKLRLGQNEAGRLQGQGMQAMQGLQQNIDPLSRFGENLGTESGRFQVLQDTFGGSFRPQYDLGQRRLDQLFLQTSPDANLGQIQSNIGSAAQQGQREMMGLQQNLDQGISGIRTGAEAARGQILGAIGDFTGDQRGALGTLYSNIGDEQQVRESELDKYLQEAIQQFSSGNLQQDTAERLGITGPTRVADLNLGEYANENIRRAVESGQVSMADVIDRQDFSDRLAALSQLAGTNLDSYNLGTRTEADVLFDANKFQQDAGNQLNTYENRFFDRSTYDLMSPRDQENYRKYLNNEFSPYNQQQMEQYFNSLKNQTLLERMQGVTGGGTRSGVFGVGGHLADLRSDNMNTRDSLQAIRDRTKQLTDLGYFGYTPDGLLASWDQALQTFDTDKENMLTVGSNAKGIKSPTNDAIQNRINR